MNRAKKKLSLAPLKALVLTMPIGKTLLLRVAWAIGLALHWTNALSAEINVSAAASLAESLKEIAQAYERVSGDRIVLNLGASSTLARQIDAGAPADLFFSADEAKMDELQQKELVVKGTRRSRLSNSLVIVVAAEAGAPVQSPRDLASAKIKRLALGDPKAVPIGIYAREYLQKLGLWAAVEPKVVITENVRAALAAVEAGNADAGIVYNTDAATSSKVRVAYAVQPADGPKISYSMALIKSRRSEAAARRFLEYLDSNNAGKVFAKHGFIVLEAASKP